MPTSPRVALLCGLVAALSWPAASRAETGRSRASAGGYFRIMTRPDFQGGDGRLGYWNLYGRLLNEGPWGALELKLDMLEQTAGSNDVWASVHAKIEGGTFANTDSWQGWLGQYGVTQMYVRAGNLLFPHVTWQLGTLDSYFGDLGLYDMKPAQIFFDTVGLSARYDVPLVEVLVGVGDAGYFIRGTRWQGYQLQHLVGGASRYNTIFTGGGHVKLRLGGHVEVGAGGQYYYEPKTPGNRYAPHQSPAVDDYEDYYRGEVLQSWVDAQPGRNVVDFPDPEARAASSYKLIAYLGFGKLGPLRWDSLYAHYLRRHPESFTHEEAYPDVPLYVTDQTDERYDLTIGNEMQIEVLPGRIDAVWGLLYGRNEDRDNTIAAGEDNRTFYSTVLRLQTYITPTVHVLLEGSVAQEISERGRLWREHHDSSYENTDGPDGYPVADARGLQLGDTDTRTTEQIKLGIVLSPLGTGIYTRPSLRILYGLQHSNVHNAFPNNYSTSKAQDEQFPDTRDRHWHSVVAIEAEAWF